MTVQGYTRQLGEAVALVVEAPRVRPRFLGSPFLMRTLAPEVPPCGCHGGGRRVPRVEVFERPVDIRRAEPAGLVHGEAVTFNCCGMRTSIHKKLLLDR